jgi:hypothetical protein
VLSGLATIHSQLLADATALLAGDDDLLYLSCFSCRCGHVGTGSIGPRPDEPKPKRNARQRSPHQVGSTTVDSNIEPLVQRDGEQKRIRALDDKAQKERNRDDERV